MNILLISLPEKNKDMKLEATEVLPLALYSLSSVFKNAKDMKSQLLIRVNLFI